MLHGVENEHSLIHYIFSQLAEGPSLIIHHPDQVLANMGEWCVKQHGESGLTEAVKNSQVYVNCCTL